LDKHYMMLSMGQSTCTYVHGAMTSWSALQPANH